MDYKIVVASPALENAVKSHFSTSTPPRRFGRSSLRDVVVPAAGADIYSGPFSVTFNPDRTKLIIKGGYVDLFGGYYPDTEIPAVNDDVIGIRADWSDAEKKYLIQVSSNSNGWQNKPSNQFNAPHIQFAHTETTNGILTIVQDWTRYEVYFRELFIV